MTSLTPHEALSRYWGHESFRPGQESIIQSIMARKDTLAILPTGSGKSICYQVPALCSEGCALVISPLIALMQDQVAFLKVKGIPAEFIHSGLRHEESERIIVQAVRGQVKMLYISPERFTQKTFIEKISQLRISFIALDEAHCVSQWGYDFRPSYLSIADVKETLGCPMLALTATAPPHVRADIISRLRLNGAQELIYSSARPKLSLSVSLSENKTEKLRHILSKFSTSGLVYVRNRRITAETAETLRQYGLSCEHYHAGLPHEERKKKLEDWMSGNIRFLCCTTAFGMGIDKSDVDIIVHLDLPLSIEEYFQEAGRAGRGGQKAYATVLYNARDLRRLEVSIDHMFPPVEEVRHAYKCLCFDLDLAEGSRMDHSVDFDLTDFCHKYRLQAERTGHALRLLMQNGLIYLSSGVFNPSRIRILADKRTLEHYYEMHPDFRQAIQTMLRLYEGILSSDIAVHEKDIAMAAGISRMRLTEVLSQLKRESVISYKLQSEKPQVQIIGDRLNSRQVKLDEQMLASRKKTILEQVHAMTGYLSTTDCRQQYILKYLGEEKTGPCGICDQCLRHKKKLGAETRSAWTREIMDILEAGRQIPITAIYRHFPENKSHWVDDILEELTAEKKISRERDFLCLP